MTIEDEIEQYLSKIKINDIITTKKIKTDLSKINNRSEKSYIPSDYCYNRTNKGIKYENQPHYFLYLERGKYQYKGKNYDFKGIVESDPRS